MKPRAQQLERELDNLSFDEMMSVYAHLIAAMHEKETASELDEERRTTLRRRVKEIDAGEVTGDNVARVLNDL